MDELIARIAFSRLRGIARKRKREIMEASGPMAPLFEGRSGILDGASQQEIFSFREYDKIEGELAFLRKIGAEAITISDEAYPDSLRNIPDPPLVLYKKGALSLKGNVIAVIGSRIATDEGKHLAEKIGDTLSCLGITVVSGLARGIDASAHRGALKGQGKTIAVLGCGLNICYPSENRYLFNKIGEEGVLITEYGIGEKPLAGHFPERNRIIAGLAKGVLVVEASRRSGSLITARLGMEYGKEVMAIPGNIFNEESKGTNALIKQGATLIENIEDIVEACFPGVAMIEKPAVDMNEKEGYIYSIVGFHKIHVDEIIEKSEMAAQETMALLTMLEMKEAIREIAGGFYIRQ